MTAERCASLLHCITGLQVILLSPVNPQPLMHVVPCQGLSMSGKSKVAVGQAVMTAEVAARLRCQIGTFKTGSSRGWLRPEYPN